MSKETLINPKKSAVSGGGLEREALQRLLLPGHEQHRARGWLEWGQSTVLSQSQYDTSRPNRTVVPNRTLMLQQLWINDQIVFTTSACRCVATCYAASWKPCLVFCSSHCANPCCFAALLVRPAAAAYCAQVLLVRHPDQHHLRARQVAHHHHCKNKQVKDTAGQQKKLISSVADEWLMPLESDTRLAGGWQTIMCMCHDTNSQPASQGRSSCKHRRHLSCLDLLWGAHERHHSVRLVSR